ncbi:MAG: DUF349 domain-containing protein [Prevotella sp.]|nr:DUF349 domain-containing protein [Bacteroidales bacterium]MCI7654751.1 DUF349 domain-containing protein [Bacteroidales bacterium]MDY4955487.1 DUF349 domain-containing protein [Prevotella sp.]
MMDSQENALNQGTLDEQKPVNDASETQTTETANTTEANATEEVKSAPEAQTDSAAADNATPQQDNAGDNAPVEEDEGPKDGDLAQKVYKTKKEVLERARQIAQEVDNPDKDEVDHLKTMFYKLHIAEREKQQKEYLDNGGDPDKYQVLPDEDEEAFKAEMTIIKEKRAKIFQQQEAEKQENLQKKLDIIEKIKAMATSPEQANKSYNDFKALQQEWKEIKAVPAEKANELWRNYQLYVEQFYDLLNLNREAREYDFKKNLEKKTRLCEEAEKLAGEEDVISAFHQLQELHQQFRETGPVAKDKREEIWNRFKAASTVINKRHQQHFDELRAKEEDNLVRKTALCEKVEAIAKEENKGSADWDRHTKEIIEVQKEWKTIGFAPQKMNVKIFERFRAACDDFFGRKAEYFKERKALLYENVGKKKALVEKALSLTDSTDWKSTSDKLIALQKEWKTIGPVPKKIGDKLWSEFLTACNHFFEARNTATNGVHNEERTNLEKKRGIIAQLKEIADKTEADAQDKVMELIDEYNAVGHVPFKEKDKVYKEFHDILDRLNTELNISVARRKLDNFKSNLKNMAKQGEDAIDNERARLFRRYEQLKAEINTYENNLGFLNASSKKGNSLIDEMNRKVQKLKDDAKLLYDKIKAIDTANKEEEDKEEEKTEDK